MKVEENIVILVDKEDLSMLIIALKKHLTMPLRERDRERAVNRLERLESLRKHS